LLSETCFHYVTVKRGPNKRRIKPAENNDLLQLALCYEDGSEDDDEDFEMGSEDEGVITVPNPVLPWCL
jgi:hypothetical protein